MIETSIKDTKLSVISCQLKEGKLDITTICSGNEELLLQYLSIKLQAPKLSNQMTGIKMHSKFSKYFEMAVNEISEIT